MLGILHEAGSGAGLGVLVIVGGPQYRVGSHRQFVLLARALAAAGTPAFRFDYRGMGDASGGIRSFEHVGHDITSAIDAFLDSTPGLERVVLWGLCDAASAAIDYAWRDERVAGMVLLNPWVRTDEGLAKAYLKHYYLQRLASRDFWVGLLEGRVSPIRALKGLVDTVRKAARRIRVSDDAHTSGEAGGAGRLTRVDRTVLLPGRPLPVRLAEAWQLFDGPRMVILSGEDLTAAEFREMVKECPSWALHLNQESVLVHELSGATHTFPSAEWRASVQAWTIDWFNTSMSCPSKGLNGGANGKSNRL